jgi:hypothetical protein
MSNQDEQTFDEFPEYIDEPGKPKPGPEEKIHQAMDKAISFFDKLGQQEPPLQNLPIIPMLPPFESVVDSVRMERRFLVDMFIKKHIEKHGITDDAESIVSRAFAFADAVLKFQYINDLPEDLVEALKAKHQQPGSER